MKRFYFPKPGDGPISLLINRKVSGVISFYIAKQVTPNHATLFVFIVGVFASLFYMNERWVLGAMLFQFSSVVSGVDGEIARLEKQCTAWGDFFDTVTDRFVEYAVIIGMTYGLYQEMGVVSVWLGMFLLGGVFLLSTASEKFRSTRRVNYPKQEFERYFAWISAGRDARIFWLSLASIFAAFSPLLLLMVFAGLAVVLHINFLFRCYTINLKLL